MYQHQEREERMTIFGERWKVMTDHRSAGARFGTAWQISGRSGPIFLNICSFLKIYKIYTYFGKNVTTFHKHVGRKIISGQSITKFGLVFIIVYSRFLNFGSLSLQGTLKILLWSLIVLILENKIFMELHTWRSTRNK